MLTDALVHNPYAASERACVLHDLPPAQRGHRVEVGEGGMGRLRRAHPPSEAGASLAL